MSSGPAQPAGNTSGVDPVSDISVVCVCVRTTCSDFGGKIDSGLENPVTDLRAAIAAIVTAWGGRTVSDDDREIVCRFDTAANALQCTQSIQRAIAASDRPQWIGARIGCCETSESGAIDEHLRSIVQCARRLAERAAPGQTIASARIVPGLSATLRQAIQPLDAGDWASDRTGIGVPMCLVVWQDDVSTRISNPVLNDAAAVTRVERLRLRWRGETLTLDADSEAVTIGRSQNANITIESEYASRIHADVTYRDASFVLTDHSTNGTYVKTDEVEIYLHDDRHILRGEGAISLGRRGATAKGKVVFFQAESALEESTGSSGWAS